MNIFEIGDLVRDRLNCGTGAYGLGVVVGLDKSTLLEEDYPKGVDYDITGKRYDVYFNKFERIITFHGDYLEKV